MTTLHDPFEVIAAFVDGERVDPAMLKSALAEPDGRDYLVNMIALREVVLKDATTAAPIVSRPTRRWLVAAAAAIALSLGGGYALGHRLAATKDGTNLNHSINATDVAAPPPTRVINVASGSSDSQGGK